MHTTLAATSERVGWQMWVPCAGMALCSWLAFVDRQMIAVLSPTIMAETGMNAQEFGRLVTFFFVAYTLANPLWGSLLDYVGLRIGMLAAVAIWTVASASHAFVGSFLGFAAARAVLGFGEGATFPGGLRTAVESLPTDKRARGIAASFSGGTLGAILTPLIALPVAAAYGWRAAFILTGLFGGAWLLLWAWIARPPFLPVRTQQPARMAWPNPTERRVWMLVFSYALPAIAPGPIITLFQIYLNRELGVAQADLRSILWMPPLAWGVGYFFWGWIADRFAADNPRPVGLFGLLTVSSLALGFAPMFASVPAAIGLMSWACFIGGGFQMSALKVALFNFPRGQAAMMSGIASGAWSLVNAALAEPIGWLFDQQRWSEAFWLVALCPALGVSVWLALSRNR
ncbi:MAG TPA: MFS transporter [Vicinamibacterales bacterium]|jgi:ACS family hexuronate transporter-like MFS transporter|nr:MFS transporter [Vicinamibacterales bacterium]